jgi:hypothetical protein
MVELDWKPIQAQVKGPRLAELLNPEFQKALKEVYPGANVVLLYINIPVVGAPEKSEKFDHVRIGHFTKEHQDQAILTVDCDRPETLTEFQKILGEFFARGQQHFAP